MKWGRDIFQHINQPFVRAQTKETRVLSKGPSHSCSDGREHYGSMAETVITVDELATLSTWMVFLLPSPSLPPATASLPSATVTVVWQRFLPRPSSTIALNLCSIRRMRLRCLRYAAISDSSWSVGQIAVAKRIYFVSHAGCAQALGVRPLCLRISYFPDPSFLSILLLLRTLLPYRRCDSLITCSICTHGQPPGKRW